jgi:hypothetical protein
MKKGDKIVCNRIEFDNLTYDRKYNITKIVDNNIGLIDDLNDDKLFSILEEHHWYYKNYFYTLKEYRKRKLQKLNGI